MYRYDPGPDHDLAVAGMWCRMQRDGDLPGLFTRDSRNLASMLAMIQPPKVMLFEADDRGIWLAVWGEQVLNSLFTGLWIAKERRGTPGALRSLLTIHSEILRVFPTLMGVTCQPRLLAPHRRLGYNVLGEVPGMWDGNPAWLVMLTREGHEAAKRRLLRPALAEEVTRNGFHG